MPTNAYIGAGIAKGAAAVQDYNRGREMRELQLSEAKSRKEMADMQLNEYKGQAPLRESQAELQLAQTQQQLRTTNAQLLEQQTYDAFSRYDGDNDPKHLNLFLQQSRKNPLAHAANSFARIDSLQTAPRNSEIDAQLKQMGFNNVEEVYGAPEVSKNLLVATKPDGSYQIVDYNQMKAMTRYNKVASAKQLEQQEREARIAQMMRSGMSYGKVQQLDNLATEIQKQDGIPMAEAYRKAKGILDGAASTSDERIINRIMEEENLGVMEATQKYYETKKQGGQSGTNESRFIDEYMQNNPGSTAVEASQAYANRTQTSTQKELGQIDDVKSSLDEMNFFETDLGTLKPAERAKIHRHIAQIEDLRGVKMSTDDKRLARDLRNLTQLGGTAGSELTTQETGLIDRMLNSVKSYVIDEVGGKGATSAYESFRNIFRNALYGASLTQTEVQSFNKAMGTLGQQLQPVLKQLNTQMMSIKNQLESVRDLNDPYLAHYYFGSSIDDVDEAIRAIDERLDLTRVKPSKKSIRAGDKPLSTADKIRGIGAQPKPQGISDEELEAIFAGGQ